MGALQGWWHPYTTGTRWPSPLLRCPPSQLGGVRARPGLLPRAGRWPVVHNHSQKWGAPWPRRPCRAAMHVRGPRASVPILLPAGDAGGRAPSFRPRGRPLAGQTGLGVRPGRARSRGLARLLRYTDLQRVAPLAKVADQRRGPPVGGRSGYRRHGSTRTASILVDEELATPFARSPGKALVEVCRRGVVLLAEDEVGTVLAPGKGEK